MLIAGQSARDAQTIFYFLITSLYLSQNSFGRSGNSPRPDAMSGCIRDPICPLAHLYGSCSSLRASCQLTTFILAERRSQSNLLFSLGASQNGRELPHASGRCGSPTISRSTPNQTIRLLCQLTTAFLGGRAYSALPCAGAPPPQRPLSYNMPRRPGVSIRNMCPAERAPPNHVLPALRIPRRGWPRACPRTPNRRTPPSGQAWRLHCVSPKDVKQFQPPLAWIPRQTVPTPRLGQTRVEQGLDTTLKACNPIGLG